MIKQGVANYIFGMIENETNVDRNLLLEDEGFINLFKDLLNVDKIDVKEAIKHLITYIAENY